MAKRERIRAVDTAWLRMDRPNNLMMIIGVIIFEGRLDFERLKRTLEVRLLPYRRFRQKVRVDTTCSWWEDDPEFDINHHLHRTALPGDAGKGELQDLVAELVSSPFDQARPLWQFHVVENYRGGESVGTAMIMRIHHAIGDGIALIGVMNSLTDEYADAPLGEFDNSRRMDEDAEEEENNRWRLFFELEPTTNTMTAGIRFSASPWVKYLGLLKDPGQAMNHVKTVAGIAGEIAWLAAMPADAQTRLKGTPGVSKRVTWSEPILLPEIKTVGKVFGCSVNDVLLSAVAGALSTYLTEEGEVFGEVDIRALVPVNLRKPGDNNKLGNEFGMVTLDLPVGIDNPLARLYETRRRMEQLKHSDQAMAALTILSAAGQMPKFVQDLVLDLLATKASVVMTNVPGPQQTRYMAGSRIVQQMFWVPQSGNIGMGVSILSYDGKVQIGLLTDAGMVPDPQRVIACFVPEFEKILYILLLEPDSPNLTPEDIEAKLAPGLNRLSPADKTRKTRTARNAGRETATGVAANSAAQETQPRNRIPKRFR